MKRILITIAGIISVALLLLLSYNIERSSWFLSLYEASDGWGFGLAVAAALVGEIAAISLIVGEAAIALLQDEETAKRLARWAGFGLLILLAVQGIAGVVAGYARGAGRMLDTLGAGNTTARFTVAAVALVVGNLYVPVLILTLSKIAAILLQAILKMPAPMRAKLRPQMVAANAKEDGGIVRASIPIPEGINSTIDAYQCPGCSRALTPGQYGAAKRYGYCKECKA